MPLGNPYYLFTILIIFIEIIKIYVDQKEKEKEKKDKEEKINEEEKNDEEVKNDEDEKEEQKDLEELKDYIFGEFVKKLESQNDIDNIIKLIEVIEGKEKNKKEKESEEKNQKIKQESNIREIILNEFLNKLFNEKSKNLFSKIDFFEEEKNLQISLLCTLYEKGKIKKK